MRPRSESDLFRRGRDRSGWSCFQTDPSHRGLRIGEGVHYNPKLAVRKEGLRVISAAFERRRHRSDESLAISLAERFIVQEKERAVAPDRAPQRCSDLVVAQCRFAFSRPVEEEVV